MTIVRWRCRRRYDRAARVTGQAERVDILADSVADHVDNDLLSGLADREETLRSSGRAMSAELAVPSRTSNNDDGCAEPTARLM